MVVFCVVVVVCLCVTVFHVLVCFVCDLMCDVVWAAFCVCLCLFALVRVMRDALVCCVCNFMCAVVWLAFVVLCCVRVWVRFVHV